jgi:hypothetical protein
MLSLRRTLVRSVLYSVKRIFGLFFLITITVIASAQSDSGYNKNDTAILNSVTVTAFSSGYKWKEVPALLQY